MRKTEAPSPIETELFESLPWFSFSITGCMGASIAAGVALNAHKTWLSATPSKGHCDASSGKNADAADRGEVVAAPVSCASRRSGR
jgi:hypothetical protein